MSNRNRILIIVALIIPLLLLSAFGISRWVRVILPEQFGIERVYITLKPDSIFLKIRAEVPGNGIAELLLDSLRYSVAFDTAEFSSGIKIFDSETSDSMIDLPLGMDREKLFSTINKLQVKDSTSLNIRLEPYINLPGSGKGKIPFTINKKMKVPIPPEITLDDIDMERLRLREIDMNVTLKVVNLNPVEFLIYDGNINLDFPGLMNGDISIEEPVHLKKRDTTYIETALVLGEVKIVRTAWNYAFNKEKMDYNFRGLLHIATTDDPADTIDVVVKK